MVEFNVKGNPTQRTKESYEKEGTSSKNSLKIEETLEKSFELWNNLDKEKLW